MTLEGGLVVEAETMTKTSDNLLFYGADGWEIMRLPLAAVDTYAIEELAENERNQDGSVRFN